MFNLVDIAILVLILVGIIRWARIGLVQGVFSLIGLLSGLIVGVLLAPYAMQYFANETTRFLIAILVVGASVIAFDSLFEYVGNHISVHIQQPLAIKINAVLGAVFSIFSTIVFIWLGIAMLAGSPFTGLNAQVQSSALVQAINSRMPSAPPVVARINSLISPLDFPQVFVGPPPQLSDPVAPTGSASVQAAVRAAGTSTVRIEGQGCGGRLFGSGFVVADGLVMTNAHVVGGTSSITVQDTAGIHDARVVYFDPELDVAVLRTNGLAGRSLQLVSAIESRGSAAVIMGFPGGGSFVAGSASVLRQLNAKGLDIYSRRAVTRSIYELQAHVVPGNSGGPVVLEDGRVIGMVFAAAEDGSEVGYSVTSPSLINIVNQAKNSNSTVSTQQCSKHG